MQINEFIIGGYAVSAHSTGVPWFSFAIVLGVSGVILFVIANVMMRATGDSIEQREFELRRYRDMRFTEQLTEFYSDPRNKPIGLEIGGIALFGLAIVAAILGIIQLLF